MDKQRIKTIILMYNQAIDAHHNKMVWLLHKNYPQNRKHIIAKSIAETTYHEIMFIHAHLLEEAGITTKKL